MAPTHLWNAPDLVPSIKYSDLPRAIDFFQRVFGFRERVEARLTWPGGGRTWIEVGNGLFNIASSDEATPRDANGAVPGVIMKVYVDNVDQHFSHAKAQGATIVCEPRNGFWGGRIYRVLDHEGYQWEIAQRGRDLAADQWQLPPGTERGAGVP